MFYTITAEVEGFGQVTIDLAADSIVNAAAAGVGWFTRTCNSPFEVVKVEVTD